MPSYSKTNADLTREELVDNGDGTGTLTLYAADGTVTSTQALTDLSPKVYGSLDTTGALATLLVVEGVLPLSDASLAVGEEEAHLVHEAEAWGLAP